MIDTEKYKSLSALKLGIITLQYPPVGGGYSERITGLIKQWSEHNINMTVVTAEISGMELPQDPKSELDVAAVKTVFHLPTLRGRLSFGLLKNGGRGDWLYRALNRVIPIDAQLIWSLLAALKLIQLIRRDEVNMYLTTSTPYSIHVVGLLVSRLYPSVKWIADFRDPWTTNYQSKNDRIFPPYKILNRWVEKRIYKRADAVVINTHQNLEDLKTEFDVDTKSMYVIQNGYNPETPITGEPALPRTVTKYRVGYVGGFRGDWFEAPFINAIAKLKTADQNAYERLEILLVGVDKIRGELADNLGVSDRFTACGFHPRHMLGSWFSSMDALVLVLPDNDERSLGWVPQRLYLYLATNLPIICISPEGEAAGYVRDTGRGVVIHPNNTLEISEVLGNFINSELPNAYQGDAQLVESFSKRVLSQKFLDIFHTLLVKQSTDDKSRIASQGKFIE